VSGLLLRCSVQLPKLYQPKLALLSAFHIETADPKVCYDATRTPGARKRVGYCSKTGLMPDESSG
jgi:hypothetical protein